MLLFENSVASDCFSHKYSIRITVNIKIATIIEAITIFIVGKNFGYIIAKKELNMPNNIHRFLVTQCFRNDPQYF